MIQGALCVSDNHPIRFGFVKRIPHLEKSAQLGVFQKDPILFFYVTDDSVTYFCKRFFFRSKTNNILNSFKLHEVEFGQFCNVSCYFPVIVKKRSLN